MISDVFTPKVRSALVNVGWVALLALPLAIAVVLAILILLLNPHPLRGIVVLLLSLMFGFSLNHTIISFSGAFRNLILLCRGRSFRVLIFIFSLASLGSFLVSKCLPNATTLMEPRKPIDFSGAPTSLSVVIGSFLFGIGMQFSGCCASGSLVEVGTGLFRSFLVTITFIIGATLASTNIFYTFWSESTELLPAMSLLSNEYNAILVFVIQFSLLLILFYLSLEWENYHHGFVEERPLMALAQWRYHVQSVYWTVKDVINGKRSVSEVFFEKTESLRRRLRRLFEKVGMLKRRNMLDYIDISSETDSIDIEISRSMPERILKTSGDKVEKIGLKFEYWIRYPWESYAGGLGIALFQLGLLVFAGHLWGVMGLYPVLGCLSMWVFGYHCDEWTYFQEYTSFKSNLLELDIFVMDVGLLVGGLFSSVLLHNFVVVNIYYKNWRTYLTAPLGGVLMGIGSRFAYGCNIGALFTGITSFSPSGWTWFLFGFFGNVVGVMIISVIT